MRSTQSVRNTQHRQSRESPEAKKTRELEELRSECKRLTKDNARLRREIQKRYGRDVDAVIAHEPPDVLNDEPVEVAKVGRGVDPNACPNCPTGTLTSVLLGVTNWNICKECKFRCKL
jgi:hypothetical protein